MDSEYRLFLGFREEPKGLCSLLARERFKFDGKESLRIQGVKVETRTYLFNGGLELNYHKGLPDVDFWNDLGLMGIVMQAVISTGIANKWGLENQRRIGMLLSESYGAVLYDPQKNQVIAGEKPAAEVG